LKELIWPVRIIAVGISLIRSILAGQYLWAGYENLIG